MSKSFSVRSSFSCIAVFVLAACNPLGAGDDDGDAARASKSGVITRPDTSVADVASAEPGKDRHQWDAADAKTRAKTGNLTASVEGRGGPLMLAFANGITEQAERDVRLLASESVGVSNLDFASLLDADPDASVYLYRVANEDVAAVAKSGGLCGAEKTTFLAVTEHVGGDGDWVFRIAAFKGTDVPGPGALNDPALCGAYRYVTP